MRQKVAGVDGRFDFQPNLSPYFWGSNAVLRWKEGHRLPPTATAAVVFSSDAKDAPMLLHHSFQLPYVLLCVLKPGKRVVDSAGYAYGEPSLKC